MATRFVCDTEIAAGFFPLAPMRWHSPATRAELRQKVSQFVTEGAFHFRGIVLAQSRIERDQVPPKIGTPSRAEESGVPFDSNLAS